MAGKFIKGALVAFMPTFLAPVPNVIVFQYNPESMTHSWSQAQTEGGSWYEREGKNPLAVSGVPGESFSFTIAMDARDAIADSGAIAKGISNLVESIAQESGIYSRLAALEMLLYPTGAFEGSDLLGTASAKVKKKLLGSQAKKRDIPQSQLPTVLFVWGKGRILPVRVTQLTITEQLYDEHLNPIHAEAQLGLQVLTPQELQAVQGELREVAIGAYIYSQGLRQVLAVKNLTDSADIHGMLPV